MRYLDPKNYLTFWKVFGEHPLFLKSFLNAMLPLEVRIKELEYLPVELVPEVPVLRKSIVNVRCIDENDRQFIVEVQMLWTGSFKTRISFKANNAFVRQFDKPVDYMELQPLFVLCLVNAQFDVNMNEFYHHYKIVHLADSKKVLKGLEFVFVEIPKFKASNYNEKRLQVLWLRYLSEIKNETETISPELFEVPEIREAIDLLQESAYTKSELAAYDKYWDSISIERSLLAGSFSDGEIAGMIKGEIKGVIKGEIKGMTKGIELMVVNGYQEGIPIALLSKMAQLSEDEVASILLKHGLIS